MSTGNATDSAGTGGLPTAPKLPQLSAVQEYRRLLKEAKASGKPPPDPSNTFEWMEFRAVYKDEPWRWQGWESRETTVHVGQPRLLSPEDQYRFIVTLQESPAFCQKVLELLKAAASSDTTQKRETT